jgi:choline dehydrogenase
LLFSVTHEVNLITHSKLLDPAFAVSQIIAYNTNRTGMFCNQGDDMLAWEKLPASYRKKLSRATQEGLAKFPADWPELEFLMDDAYFGFGRDIVNDTPRDGKMYATVAGAIITPFKRGNVTILSNDTSDNPAVSPNYLIDPRDEEIIVAAFKRVREVFKADALRPILIGEEFFPGKNVSTDAEILEFIRQAGLEVYHASATCKMGKRHDRMAVVDSLARVIGVEGLRVVDASAFPFLPPGHPQATVCK